MAKALATKNPVSERMRSIRRVLWVILVLNLAVAAAKYVYGLMSGSASMQADGIHSVFDSAGNVVGLVGIALAARPADDSHPYGHAKFETYASLVIGVLLLLAAFEVGSSAVGKLVSGVYTAEVTPVSFIVMVGTLAVNIGVDHLRAPVREAAQKRGACGGCEPYAVRRARVHPGVIVGLAAVALGFPMAEPHHGARGDRRHPGHGLRRIQARASQPCPIMRAFPTRTCVPWRWACRACRMPIISARAAPRERCTPTCTCSWRPG